MSYHHIERLGQIVLQLRALETEARDVARHCHHKQTGGARGMIADAADDCAAAIEAARVEIGWLHRDEAATVEQMELELA